MHNEMPTSNHLFIVQPLSAVGSGGLANLFRTPPATEQRITKLMEMA